MKLDFSALTQPASKERGQVGTTGTQASTRVAASPTAGDTLGTSGDTARRLRPGLYSSAEVPAVCPPLSPPCPRSLGTCKPNVHAVSPVSPVVPTESGNCAARIAFVDRTRAVPESTATATPATNSPGTGATVASVAGSRKAEKTAPASIPAKPPDAMEETRRARVLALLAGRPGVRYAVVTDEIDPTYPGWVVFGVGIRSDDGTFFVADLIVPRERYDDLDLLALVERNTRGNA